DGQCHGASLASSDGCGYPRRMNETTVVEKTPAHPARLGWRILALVYDSLPMIPLAMLTSFGFLWLHGGRTVENSFGFALLQLLTIWALIGLYFVLSWRRGGQTMGMRPWRLRVVANDGRPGRSSALWLR